jgi:Tfp pilus assembly protein PilO
MSDRFCSVMILGPAAPRMLKVHLSRGAIAILVMAFVLSFLAVVMFGYTFPKPVSEVRRAQLEAENRALKNEAANAAIGLQRLDAKVLKLEEATKRIDQTMTAD